MAAHIETFETLPDMFHTLVPAYKSRSYKPLLVTVKKWSPEYAPHIAAISARRTTNRIASYVDLAEVKRAKKILARTKMASIRFGVKKEGHGLQRGGRGDFCMVAGIIERRSLTLCYRSLELIGGLAYDLPLIDFVGAELGIEWRSVTFFAKWASVFPRRGNSNEKLFPKLQQILAR